MSVKIAQKLLENLGSYFRAKQPNESFVLLRSDGITLVEAILVPGVVSNGSKALYRYDLMPKTITYVGTAHSHPGRNLVPSSADLDTFYHYGDIHLIMCEPWNITSVRAFDTNGAEQSIEII